MNSGNSLHSSKFVCFSNLIWIWSSIFIVAGCSDSEAKLKNENLVTAVALEVRENAQSRTDEDTLLSTQSLQRKEQELTPAVDAALRVLNEFDGKSLSLANAPVAQLKTLMDHTLVELDALAIEENLTYSDRILENIKAAQQTSLLAAAAAVESINKGLWIKWSEKLLLTQDALKHFFQKKLSINLKKQSTLTIQFL